MLKLIKIFLAACAIAAPMWLIFLIGFFAVNVPFGDEWYTPGNIFSAIHNQSRHISFSDLIAQHNEARPLFPKIAFISTIYMTHWDVRYNMIIIFLMACLVSINLFYIARKTIAIRGFPLWLLMAIVNLLIFSPAQYENWLWGFQIVIIAPTLCLTTGLRVCYSNLKTPWRFFLCVCISIVSTYSFANGLLCWILLPLAFVTSGQWKILKNQMMLILLWSIACMSTLMTYLWDYKKPMQTPNLTESLFHPLKALNYFAVFLGSSISGGDITIASITGFFIVIIFGLVLTVLFLRRHDAKLRYDAGAWLTLTIYAFITATVTTFGRMGFGIEQALSSRYALFSVCAIVGLVGLVMLVISEVPQNEIQVSVKSLPFSADITSSIVKTSGGRKSIVLPLFSYKFCIRNFVRNLYFLLIFLLISLHVMAQDNYVGAMDMMRRDRLYAKTCLAYADFVENGCMTQSLSVEPSVFKKTLEATRALGILEQENFAQNAQLVENRSTASNSYNYGWIDGVQLVDGNDFMASGWATLENPGRTADAVLLSYTDDNGENRVFTVAPVKFDRPDVAKVKKDPTYIRSGWTVKFFRNSLPKRKVEIRAWAYDTKTKNTYLLSGSHTLM